MQGLIVQTNKPSGLLPLFPLDVSAGQERDVNLAAGSTLVQGQLLGQVANTANDVQTLTITGTPTGGSLTLGATNPLTNLAGTFSVPFNATAAVAQANAQGFFGPGNVVVTGGAAPGTPLVFTGAGALAGVPIPLMTVAANLLTGGATPAGAIVKTTTGRTAGTFVKYDSTVLAPPAAGVTPSGNGAGSTFLAGVYRVTHTFVNAAGETIPGPSVLASVTANQNIRVAALAGLPAGVTAVNFYVDGILCGTAAVASNATAQTDLTGYPAGASVRAPGSNLAYTQPNGAGCEKAICVLRYDATADASGLIAQDGFAIGGGYVQALSARAYFGGTFRGNDLVGLDAKAIADLGRLTSFSAGSQILEIYSGA